VEADQALVAQSAPTVSFDDESSLASEGPERRLRDREAEFLGQPEAEVLVDVEPVEVPLRGRLEDVGGRRTAGRYAPPLTIVKQRHLGLCPG
jgi:hypothetical protein